MKLLSFLVGLFLPFTLVAQSTYEYVPDYISNVTLSTGGNHVIFDIMRDRCVKLQLVGRNHIAVFDFIEALDRWNNYQIQATGDFVLGEIELEPNQEYRLEYELNSYFKYWVLGHNPTNGFSIKMRTRNSPTYNLGTLAAFTLNRIIYDTRWAIQGTDGFIGCTDWFNSTELAGAGFEGMIELVMDLAH